jgi:hypothetical protein
LTKEKNIITYKNLLKRYDIRERHFESKAGQVDHYFESPTIQVAMQESLRVT